MLAVALSLHAGRRATKTRVRSCQILLTTTTMHVGEEVEAETLAVGAVITVRSGDCVPVDGVVTRGASAVDESMLTGEAAPEAKGAGDAVSGGTLNVGGSTLEVRAHPVGLVF